MILKENKKSKSEGEYWKGKYKELLSENKRLKRELSRLQNTDHEFEEFKSAFQDFSEQKEEKKKKDCCPSCAKGKLVVISIPGGKNLRLCKICQFRETVIAE